MCFCPDLYPVSCCCTYDLLYSTGNNLAPNKILLEKCAFTLPSTLQLENLYLSIIIYNTLECLFFFADKSLLKIMNQTGQLQIDHNQISKYTF